MVTVNEEPSQLSGLQHAEMRNLLSGRHGVKCSENHNAQYSQICYILSEEKIEG